MSGVYTDIGRGVIRGADLIDNHEFWVVLGRARLSSTVYGGVDFPWQPDEAYPDAEDPANTILASLGTTYGKLIPDRTPQVYEMGELAIHCGAHKADKIFCVSSTSASSDIFFNNSYWVQADPVASKYLYLQFTVLNTEFVQATDNNYSITGYRRLNIVTDMVPIVNGTTSGRYNTDIFSDLGTILFSSNEVLRERDINENHIIEIILPL